MPSKGTKKAAKMDCTEHSPGAEELAADSYANTLDSDLHQVIQEVTENISKMMDEKQSPLSLTHQNHTMGLKSLDTRTTEAEGQLSVVETVADEAQSRIWALEKQVQSLSDHIDDPENRDRRKNIWIIGQLEGTEGRQAAIFFECCLPNFFDFETKAERIEVERAHCFLAPKLGPEQCPRPVLVQFHYLGDKQRVVEALRCRRIDAALVYEGSKHMFFQDFSAAIIRKCREFNQVKKRLRESRI